MLFLVFFLSNMVQIGGPDSKQAAALQEARELYEKSVQLRGAGRYDDALSLLERVLEIRERVLGPDHPEVATALNGLAVLHWHKAGYAQAQLLCQRGLSIREKVLGPDHPEVAESLNTLANIYIHQGGHTKVEPIYRRALAIWEKALGPEHPDVARALNNLGGLYHHQADYARAEPLYQRAVLILEKVAAAGSSGLARTLNNLANLYQDKGDYAKAEPIYRRALAIRENVLGPDHTDVADSLSSSGSLYRKQGEYATAESFYQRAREIYEKALGPKHPDVAGTLNGMALLYHIRGEEAKAEPFYRRALEIYEKALGSDHTLIASLLNNLASLYRSTGEYGKAEPLYQRALSIRERVLGPDHPEVAESLTGLAVLSAAKCDLTQARSYLSRANIVGEHNLALNLLIGSERQKLAYLALFSAQTDFTFSLLREADPGDLDARTLAFTTLLHWKGRGLDAMTDTMAVLRRRAGPEGQSLLDQLTETRSRLAALTLRGATTAEPGAYREQLRRLEEEVEMLESKLSSHRAEFRAHIQPVRLSAVQAAIPAGTALVEFVVHTPRELRTGARQSPRYLVFLMTDEGPPRWADLGETAIIDRALETWRPALRNPYRTDLDQLARVVDHQVMQPVRSLLREMKRPPRHLLIAPDGLLNLIPFAALVDEQNRYLVERYTISYLTSGRDLLRLQTLQPSRNPPLIVANPIFGRVKTGAEKPIPASITSPAGIQSGVQEWARIDSTEIFFQELPGTEREALAIKAMLPGALVLLREQATESTLRRSKAPSLLHIATHGFFFNQETPAAEAHGAPYDNLLRFSVDLSKWAAKIENPFLRSGLVLAGVNERRPSGDDGVLTALEAVTLDLWGTRLVVLSACDTGVGEVKNGEGVQGLRRALVLAGSETQVMSLWSAPDEETRRLMIGYYRRLLKGEGRGEALRQIQLEMLKYPRLRHPYYWANFIQIGEWANLDGRR